MSVLSPAKILIVDDLPEKILVYETILAVLGQEVHRAASGPEALRMVLANEYAVVLLDVNMPGMDGFETASLIRARKRSAQTPIIFVTGIADEMLTSEGYAIGAADYILTPVVPEILRAKVRVFVELHRMRQQAAIQAEQNARRSAAEAAAARLAFLADAGVALLRSLDVGNTFRLIPRLAVPQLAECCIAIPTEPTMVRETEAAWADDDAGLVHWSSGASLEPWPELVSAVRRVAAGNSLEFVSIADRRGQGPQAEQPSALPLLHGGHAIVLPLPGRERLFGVVVAIRSTGSPPFNAEDVSISRSYAVRAGVSVENALLVSNIREADRRKDEFLAMLAHELRNPLAPIFNAVELLRRSGSGDERVRFAREVIDRQAGQMARLVEDLLDASRIARGMIELRRSRVDLSRIVRDTVEDYRSVFDEKGVGLFVETPAKPAFVDGDATRIAQCVGNLLHNSHKFTSTGGRVDVRVVADREAGAASVVVGDDGSGISPTLLSKVFDLFTQADQGLARPRGGLGLGLALVKGLVELHSGTVSAESEGVDRGATFILSLPLQAPPAETPTGPAMEPASPARQYRIMIVEDVRDTAESLATLLRLDGHEVEVECSGERALETMPRFQPQVLICDIGLPGLDGYSFMSRVKQEHADLGSLAIAVSGYGREEDRNRAFEVGFNEYFVKPLDVNRLQAVLASPPVAIPAG